MITDRCPCPRPPVIHDGWYRWSCPAVVPPPQSRDIRNRNLLQLHTAELPEPPAPTRSWPAARHLMNLPHCERRAPIDTTDAAVHKTKRQAVSSVYSHTMSQFNALIVRYIGSCLQTWAIKLVCNNRRSALSESVVTESFYIEFNSNSAGANKKVRTNRASIISRSVLTKFYCITLNWYGYLCVDH